MLSGYHLKSLEWRCLGRDHHQNNHDLCLEPHSKDMREHEILFQQRKRLLDLCYPLVPIRYRPETLQRVLNESFVGILASTRGDYSYLQQVGTSHTFVPNISLLWVENASKNWAIQYALRRRRSKQCRRLLCSQVLISETDKVLSLNLNRKTQQEQQQQGNLQRLAFLKAMNSEDSEQEQYTSNNNNNTTPPSWLPKGWKLGDPLAEEDLSLYPGWSECTQHLDKESLGELQDFMRTIGDPGKNQLARPVEYLAQAKDIERKIAAFFDNQGTTRPLSPVTLPDGKIQNKLDWFKYTYPELEFYYDKTATSCTPITVFYFSLIGRNLPPMDRWVTAAKVEMLNVIFQKVSRTEVYVPSNDHAENPYTLQNVMKGDEKILSFIANTDVEKESQHLLNLEDKDRDILEQVWAKIARKSDEEAVLEDNEDVVSSRLKENYDLVKENLIGSTFWRVYFCNLMENSMDHPSLSPKENYAVGNSEMLKKEDVAFMQRKENTKSLLQKWSATEGNSIVINSGSMGDYDEKKPKWLLRMPRVSTVSKLCSPQADALYINGHKFLEANSSNLFRTFGKEKVGFNTIKKDTETYRVIIRTGVTPYHFRDFDPNPRPYPNEEEFNRFFSYMKNLQTSTISSSAATKNTTSTTSLISSEDLAYMQAVGIHLPDTVVRLETKNLPQLINKKRKEIMDEIGGPITATKKRRTNSASSPLSSLFGNMLEDNNKVNTLEALFKKQRERNANLEEEKKRKRILEESPIYKISQTIDANPKSAFVPFTFGRFGEK